MALNQGDLILLRGLVSEKESQLRTLIVNQVEAGEMARAKNMVEALRDFEALHTRIQAEVKGYEDKLGMANTPVATPVVATKPAPAFALPTRASKTASGAF